MNSPQSRALPALMLSTLLALPAAVWAVPSYSLPAGSDSMPQPYRGEKCQASAANQAASVDEKQVSFERLHSPCRLEDSDMEKGMRTNEDEEPPAKTLSKIEEWDGLNKPAHNSEHEPEWQPLQVGRAHGDDHSKGSVLEGSMAPVPEPETYAMLLGGLAVLAARPLLRRRDGGRA